MAATTYFGVPSMAETIETLRAEYDRVRSLQADGQFEAALGIALTMVEPARRLLGPNDDALAEILSTKGILLRSTGRGAEAEAPYLEALSIRRRIFPEDHPGVAVLLSNLGVLYSSLDRHAEAEDMQRTVLAIRRRTLPSGDARIATTLSNLAVACIKQHKLGEAEQLLDEALAIHDALPEGPAPGVLDVLETLGRVYEETGRRNDAFAAYERALAVARAVLPDAHPRLDALVRGVARHAFEAGQFTTAQALYEEAIQTVLTTQGEDDPDLIELSGNLALVCHALGDFANAEEIGRFALERARGAGGDPIVTSAIMATLASVYRDVGRLADAESMFEESLAILRKTGGPANRQLALAMNNLGSTYRRRGKTVPAARLFEEAIEIQRRLPEARGDLLLTLNNLAVLHLEQGDYEAAEPLLLDVLARTRSDLPADHPQQAHALNNLAELYRDTGRVAEAEAHQKDANALYEKRNATHPSLARGLINLGKVYAQTGRHREAFAAFLEAAAIDDASLGEAFSFGSERHRLEYVDSILLNLYSVVSLVVEHLSGAPDVVRGAFDLVLRRKAIGLEALAVQRDLALGGRYPELMPAFRALTTLRTEIARAEMSGPGAGDAEAHRASIAQMQMSRERMESDLVRALAQAHERGAVRAVTAGAVAQRLPEGSVLVEILRFPHRDFNARIGRDPLWGADRYVAFLLGAGDPDGVQLVDLGEAAPLEEALRVFRASLGANDGLLKAGEVAPPTGPDHAADQALSARLLAPLITKLGGRNRLLVAPDGELARLPFEVLRLDDGRRTIAEYEVSYVGSGRDVLRFGERRGTASPPVVVADPDFDARAATAGVPRMGRGDRRRAKELETFSFTRLPAARKEGEEVAALLGVKTVTGDAALEGWLRTCRSPRILHVATHGWFLPQAMRFVEAGPSSVATMTAAPAAEESTFVMVGRVGEEAFAAAATLGPGRMGLVGLQSALLRSGLALAGANTWLRDGPLPEEAEDGMLTAEDVSGLDLFATELVVLSACDTGLGDARLAEGVLGLRRACVIAGASTLVMSLWKVPDKQTQQLMADFYRRIMRGEPRAAALRQAQLALQTTVSNPFYWGAFICQGDPGPLRGED